MDKMQLDMELLEKYVSDGLTQTEIANRLYVSQQTVRKNCISWMRSIQAKISVQAAVPTSLQSAFSSR